MENSDSAALLFLLLTQGNKAESIAKNIVDNCPNVVISEVAKTFSPVKVSVTAHLSEVQPKNESLRKYDTDVQLPCKKKDICPTSKYVVTALVDISKLECVVHQAFIKEVGN